MSRSRCPRRQNGRFVQHVLKVGARKAGGALGQHRKVHIRPQGLVAGVDLQNVLAALHVRRAHGDLPVKPAGAQKRRVQNVRAVGGRHYNNAGVGVKAVHLHQQLVQGLLALVVTAAQAGAAVAPHGVDLVDEDDGRGRALGGRKQIPHARSAHANKHLHKVRTGNREERRAGLARHGLGQQRLAGSRRAHQQHALGHARAHFGKPPRVLQKLHDLLQLFLLFVRAGHVAKRHLVGAARHHPRLGLAEVADALAAALLLHHKIQQEPHGGNEDDVRHQIPEAEVGRLAVGQLKPVVERADRRSLHALARGHHGRKVLFEQLVAGNIHLKVRPVGQVFGRKLAAGIQAGQAVARQIDGQHLLVAHQFNELVVVQLVRRARRAQAKTRGHKNDRHDEHQVYDQCFVAAVFSTENVLLEKLRCRIQPTLS